MNGEIRIANEEDAAAVAAIYAPFVETSAATAEISVPDIAEIQRRIRETLATLPWLVFTWDDKVIAYAYASKHRAREAYLWSVDVSVYVSPPFHGKGIARRLYAELFKILKNSGYVNAFAGIGMDNERSIRLHESLGFALVGIYRSVAFKLGAWHDVGWWQLRLRDPGEVMRIPSFGTLGSGSEDEASRLRDCPRHLV
jgi:L-amino acid N-acyltransferase YncA